MFDIRYIFRFRFLLIGLSSFYNYSHEQNLELRYNQPAKYWEETLSLNNSLIGMMPEGKVETEQIVLNEISI